MHNNFSRQGFTLIELLVVIAIIGLLSSIVFASLDSARKKAKDATIKSEVAQMRKLMDFVYDDTGSYASMQQAGWVTTTYPTCTAYFANADVKYKAQAIAICDKIIEHTPKNGTTNLFWSTTGMGGGTVNDPKYLEKYYSIMVPLNNGKIFCSGSSGVSAEYSSYGGWPDTPNTQPAGCWGNP